MQIRCDECNKTFNKSKGDMERSKHHFCCRECYHRYRRRNIGVHGKKAKVV